MRIVQVEHIPFEPRFSGSGYAMSMTRQIILYDKLLRITLEDGSQGVGENVRWLSYPVAAAEAAEEEMLPQLEGAVLADLPRLMRDWCRRGKEWRGFCFALHSAYLDIVSQKLGVPVASLLGGPAHGFVPEYLSLSSETPEEMATMIRSRGADYHIIQAKLGTGEVEEDIARVRAVLDAMTPQQMLLADFNGALTVDTALRWLGKIEDPRLMWEEPCDTYDENIEVAKKISMPFMFDQSMTDIETYIRAIQDRYAEAVVIKPSLLGPLSEAVVVRDCRYPNAD